MSTEIDLASRYRVPSTANNSVYAPPAVVHLPRERVKAPSRAKKASAADSFALPVRCFGADQQLPVWLLHPWQLVQRASQRRRSLAARLADLSKVTQALDDLFAIHLPEQAGWFDGAEATGLSISESIPKWVDGIISEATMLFLRQLRPDLLAKGVCIKPVAQLDEWQRDWLHQHFMQRIYPLLTPLAVDPGRPFPFISSHSLNLLVELRRPESGHGSSAVERSSLYARVKVPRSTPRLIAVPTQQGMQGGKAASSPTIYVCSVDLVRFFIHHLFPGMPVRHVSIFRIVRGEQTLPGVTRSASMRVRRQDDQPVVRLDVEHGMSAPVLNWLVDHLNVPHYAIAHHDRLVDWTCLPYLAASVETRPRSKAR
jgi:polyphosphate kinase